MKVNFDNRRIPTLIGLALEVFKVRTGSWAYPDAGVVRVGGVPVFSGFMYASVGSYICQAFRRLDLHVGGFRWWPVSLLAVAAYLNFFPHHVIVDLRWVIAAGFLIALWGSAVHFTVGGGPPLEAAAGGEVAEGRGGQQVGHELVEGLRQGGEDLLDLVAVQRGLDGGAGLLASTGVSGIHGAGILQGQGDAVGLEDPVGDVDRVEGLGETDVGGALVDGLAQLERAGSDVEGGSHVGPQPRGGGRGGRRR